MKTPVNSVWSIIAFACPLVALALAFAIGRGIADEKVAFRIIGTEAICFFVLAFIGLVCAFIQRERLRWFTLVPLLLFLAMFGLGVSS